MAGAGHRDAAESFDPLRPTLMRVAYRMLGSVADAEDVMQEAFIRWMGVDRSEVREPEAFLRRAVTRLCLDQLKSARRQRETYVGTWLPEPIVEEEPDEDITLPLMLALERLDRRGACKRSCRRWSACDAGRTRSKSRAPFGALLRSARGQRAAAIGHHL